MLRLMYVDVRPRLLWRVCWIMQINLQKLLQRFVQRLLRRNLYAFLRQNVFRNGELGGVFRRVSNFKTIKIKRSRALNIR